VTNSRVVAHLVTAGRVLLLVEEVGHSLHNATSSTTQKTGSATSGTDTDSAV